MPPSGQPPFDPTDHLLAEGRRSSMGPIVGVIIIVLLLILGALYFWGAHLNAQKNTANNVPYIPAGTSTAAQ